MRSPCFSLGSLRGVLGLLLPALLLPAASAQQAPPQNTTKTKTALRKFFKPPAQDEDQAIKKTAQQHLSKKPDAKAPGKRLDKPNKLNRFDRLNRLDKFNRKPDPLKPDTFQPKKVTIKPGSSRALANYIKEMRTYSSKRDKERAKKRREKGQPEEVNNKPGFLH